MYVYTHTYTYIRTYVVYILYILYFTQRCYDINPLKLNSFSLENTYAYEYLHTYK